MRKITKAQALSGPFSSDLSLFVTSALGSPPESLVITSCIELPNPGNSSLGIVVNYEVMSAASNGVSILSLITNGVLSGAMQTSLQSSFPTVLIDTAPVAIDFSPTALPTPFPSVSPSRIPARTPWEERFNLVATSNNWLVLETGNWLFIFLVFMLVALVTVMIFACTQYIVDRPYIKVRSAHQGEDFSVKLFWRRIYGRDDSTKSQGLGDN